MESCLFSLLMIFLIQGVVLSQPTVSDKYSCSLTEGIDQLQRQLNHVQQVVDELKHGSRNGHHCGVNEKPYYGEYPSDCTELFNKGERTTGVYYIKPSGSVEPFKVFCEMAYEGWTVFQRRFNGSVNFYRTWDEYKNGFGDLVRDHWLGNEKLHALTTQGSYIFRFEMHALNNANIIAEYDGFVVEGESGFYKLHLGTFTSQRVPFGDGMAHHNGQYFTTWDRDHDRYAPYNCGTIRKGGWWYNACYRANPNGRFACQKLNCMSWGEKAKQNVYGDATILKIKRK